MDTATIHLPRSQMADVGAGSRSGAAVSRVAAVVFATMLVEIAMSLAAPWPVELVLDDLPANHHLPDWLAWAHTYGIGHHALGVALVAGVATVLIAIVGPIAACIDNYCTASVNQCVASDRRVRIHEHLQRLSPGCHDSARSGALRPMMTSDLATVQDLASSSTLGIIAELATIASRHGLHLRRRVPWADPTQAMGVLEGDLRKAGVTMCNDRLLPATSKLRATDAWPNRSNHAWLGA